MWTWASVASAGPIDFTVTAGGNSFQLAAARGKYVAVHFLPKSECPDCLLYVREYARRAPTVAGVRHVFLKPVTEEDILAWRTPLERDGLDVAIYRDAEGALAKDFGLPEDYSFQGPTAQYPALVLLGPEGEELFRHVGIAEHVPLPFDRFAAKIAEFTQLPAIKQYNLSAEKTAIQGYDPVAYFETARAVKGLSDFTSTYRGVTYHFATEANRGRFADEPDMYLPAYGGWCATAMTEGRKVGIDPASFKVTQGRLFLFYKGWRGDALKEWNKDEPALTRKADEHWNKIAPPRDRIGGLSNP